MDRVDIIYNKYKNIIETYTGKDIKESKGILKKSQSECITKDMIFEITGELSNSCVEGTINNLIHHTEGLRDMIVYIWKEKRKKINSLPCFNMRTTCDISFCGIHRSGWKFSLDQLQCLHKNYGVILDVYCDSTFGWSREHPAKSVGLIPYTSPWCGFFHHTPNTEYTDNNIVNSTGNKEFKQSLETCLGFFVMSEWLADWLRNRLKSFGYPNIPVVYLVHPTITHSIKPYKLLPDNSKIKIVNVGSWLRNTYSIYAADLNTDYFSKYKLKGKHMDNYFPPDKINYSIDKISQKKHDNSFLYCMYKYIREHDYLYKELGYNDINDIKENPVEYSKKIEQYIEKQINSVNVINYLTNEEFDNLLSDYVVFVDFIECSAANTLVECIARETPLIVNRFPAVVELLGVDYPLYFDDVSKLSKIVTKDKLAEAKKYMVNKNLKSLISCEKFFNDFYNSKISENTKMCNYL